MAEQELPDGSWHDVMPCADLPLGEVAEAVVGPSILAIIHAEEGLYAMDGLCAHQGGPLGKGKLCGQSLTCPWHGWQYDIATGRQHLGQAVGQRTYPIRSHQGTIQVYMAT